jgi:probable rRNA maturation factor
MARVAPAGIGASEQPRAGGMEARRSLDTGHEPPPGDLDKLARRVDDGLVLAVAVEPPDALAETVFGLDDAMLRRIVAMTLARAGVVRPVELSVLITGDEGIRALNRDYRGRDEATDVLSFPLTDEPLVDAPADELWQAPEELGEDDEALAGLDGAEPDVSGGDLADAAADEDEGAQPFVFRVGAGEDEPPHLGDIALSRDAIDRQAARAGHSAAWELAYLLAHGVLHLVGYDDQTDAGYRAMVAHQEAVLSSVGIGR